MIFIVYFCFVQRVWQRDMRIWWVTYKHSDWLTVWMKPSNFTLISMIYIDSSVCS